MINRLSDTEKCITDLEDRVTAIRKAKRKRNFKK